MKVYRVGTHLEIQQSKFLDPRFSISAREFEAIWPRLPPEEKLEFCAAFRAKGHLSAEDEQILNHIMQTGDERIWSRIAPVLTRHPDRGRVLTFIRDRIRQQSPPLSNFYTAIEELGDADFVPELLNKYREYREELELGPESTDRFLCMDYLNCCRALWTLTGNIDFKKSIERFVNASDGFIRSRAQALLKQST